MSTDKAANVAVAKPVGEPLDPKGVAAALVKHYGLHEGLFDLYIEYQFALGNLGPTPDQLLPSAIIGLSKMGLTQAAQVGPLTVNAAEVNPAPAVSRTKRVAKAVPAR